MPPRNKYRLNLTAHWQEAGAIHARPRTYSRARPAKRSGHHRGREGVQHLQRLPVRRSFEEGTGSRIEERGWQRRRRGRCDSRAAQGFGARWPVRLVSGNGSILEHGLLL